MGSCGISILKLYSRLAHERVLLAKRLFATHIKGSAYPLHLPLVSLHNYLHAPAFLVLPPSAYTRNFRQNFQTVRCFWCVCCTNKYGSAHSLQIDSYRVYHYQHFGFLHKPEMRHHDCLLCAYPPLSAVSVHN